jgi:hypothetical protein
MEIELAIGTTRKLYCNTCKGETHHNLEATHQRNYYETQYENTPNEQLVSSEEFEYRFWVCCGCDTATLEEAYTNNGMFDPHKEKYICESDLYPKRRERELPHKRFRQLNKKLATIYKEVIVSYNNDSMTLGAIGLRALLEGICADKAISGRDLFTKIDGLKAYLPANIVKSLHGFRFMGNVAAHELQAPKQTELRLAIEVMEDLLNFLYELEYKAQRLPKAK